LSETVSGERQETDGELVALRQVIAVLECQLMDVQSQREDWKAEREDLKAERARLLGMVENQTRLITHMAEKPTEPTRRGWWQRLTGKG
jgi:hypothetical protein